MANALAIALAQINPTVGDVAGKLVELVFDGTSFVLGADAGLAVQMTAKRPQVVATHWRHDDAGRLVCRCPITNRFADSVGD